MEKFDPVICECANITRSEIIDLIKKKKLSTVVEIADESDVAGMCGACIEKIENILNEVYTHLLL
ncbi:MAG: (2Fe-2S)-binding protein [Bacteroidetes bacterium]|nr:(2Fe-2S)-binding protein [Bacteroidota bacterium]